MSEVPIVGAAEKEGAPPLAVRMEFAAPCAVATRAFVLLPYKTPLVTTVVVPVPPFPTESAEPRESVPAVSEPMAAVLALAVVEVAVPK